MSVPMGSLQQSQASIQSNTGQQQVMLQEDRSNLPRQAGVFYVFYVTWCIFGIVVFTFIVAVLMAEVLSVWWYRHTAHEAGKSQGQKSTKLDDEVPDEKVQEFLATRTNTSPDAAEQDRGTCAEQHSRWLVALLCGSWIACGVGMNTLNQKLVHITNAPSMIPGIQMAVAALIMFGFNMRTVLDTWALYRQQACLWLISPIVFSFVLLSSSFTHAYTTLCVLTIVRNCGPLVAYPIEYALMPLEQRPFMSWIVFATMLTMLSGAVVYAISVPDISVIGIAVACLNLVLAIADRIVQRRLLANDCKNLTLGFCTFINNSVGMLPAFGLAASSSEFQSGATTQWHRFDVVVLLCLSCIVGLAMSYVDLAVAKAMSATSFLVMQNMSKVILVSVGIVVFGDSITSWLTVLGLFLSLFGSFWYGYAMLESKSPQENSEKSWSHKQ